MKQKFLITFFNHSEEDVKVLMSNLMDAGVGIRRILDEPIAKKPSPQPTTASTAVVADSIRSVPRRRPVRSRGVRMVDGLTVEGHIFEYLNGSGGKAKTHELRRHIVSKGYKKETAYGTLWRMHRAKKILFDSYNVEALSSKHAPLSF